jgi:NAD(P)-dependent dehydrogenase (short-subunit alcohol dehydrogenase family)
VALVETAAPALRGLEGRHVVVAGGAGALGREVTLALARAGAICHLPLRGKECASFEEVAERVWIRSGLELVAEEELEGFIAKLPALWALVHCAGGFAANDFTSGTLAGDRALFDSNVFSTLTCFRAAARRMRRDGRGGRLVSVAARAGLEPRGARGMAVYAASKAATAALTQALGEELAPADILVNAVAPSLMDTPANRAAMPDADHSRWPKTADVARAIAWLVSPENALVRSAVVPVYGNT